MPEPPPVGPLTRYLFENPFLVGVPLLVVGVCVAWWGLRDGRRDRLGIALVPLAAGLAMIVTGILVVTPGEHGRRVVRAFVGAVVNEDLVAAQERLADESRFHYASDRNVAHDLDFIIAGLALLADRYTIEGNRITMLRGYPKGPRRAIVHLACWTETAGGYGPTPSQWVVEVERQADGSWKISRLTWVSVSGRAPSMRW